MSFYGRSPSRTILLPAQAVLAGVGTEHLLDVIAVCEWGWWINGVRVQDWEGVEKVLDRIRPLENQLSCSVRSFVRPSVRRIHILTERRILAC